MESSLLFFFQLYRSSAVFAAILLSADTYQYSADIANDIAKLAVKDIRSNANIEAHDFFKIFENELETLTGPDLYYHNRNETYFCYQARTRGSDHTLMILRIHTSGRS